MAEQASEGHGRACRYPRSAAAFTLVEVAAAAAVLVLSVLAGTGLALLASRQVAAADGSVADRDAALGLLWSLEQLPYVAPAGSPSLVAQVFPHAVAARNSAAARYMGAAGEELPAGSFVTLREQDGRALLLVARFLARDESGAWCPVDDASLAGRDLAAADPPPALLLEVRRDRHGRRTMLAGRLFAAGPPAASVRR
jgi:hypothetical protein